MRVVAFFISLFMKMVMIVIILGALLLLTAYLLGPPHLSHSLETTLYDDKGNTFPKQMDKKKHVSLDHINEELIKATIAVEDKHFYTHYGFDIKRIVQAFLKNIQAGSLKEGASTITQQYARNLYLTHDKTWQRKIKEAFYTIRLEMFYSKEDILEGYLNTIYYGHGAYGVENASLYYFDKNTTNLSLAEMSLLVGIPKGPTYYSPFNDEKRAFERQAFILDVLHQDKIITDAQYYEAKSDTLDMSEKNEENETFAPYFTDYIIKEAAHILKINQEDLINGGYDIYTTLNPSLQEAAENLVDGQIPSESDVEVGLFSIDPETGAIKAMIGGRSYTKSTFNRATDARRSVGSTFKPIVYYTALENGFSPQTMLRSEPTTFTFDKNKSYTPSNFNDLYAYDRITLLEAIALSDNIYAVKTNMYVGTKEVIKTARRFGITSDLPDVPSLALGSASISVSDMTQAYGMMSNGGRELKNHSIKKIINRRGKTLYEHKPTKKQVFNQHKMFVLSDMLSSMFETELNSYLHVTGASITDSLTHPYSGKSGTTNSDSWMIGYSPKLVTTVWLGYDDNRHMTNKEEKAYAKDIWAKLMEHAHKGEDVDITAPPGVIALPFDYKTGKIATEQCPTHRLTYFEKGTEPNETCNEHVTIDETNNEGDDLNYFKYLFELFFGTSFR